VVVLVVGVAVVAVIEVVVKSVLAVRFELADSSVLVGDVVANDVALVIGVCRITFGSRCDPSSVVNWASKSGGVQ